MKTSQREIWLTGIASLIPGLGLIAYGKKTQGIIVLVVTGILLGNFLLFPFMITWYLFGVVFIAQLAYAVALAIKPSSEDQISRRV